MVIPQTTSLKASNTNAIEMKTAKISSVDLTHVHELPLAQKKKKISHIHVPRSIARAHGEA